MKPLADQKMSSYREQVLEQIFCSEILRRRGVPSLPVTAPSPVDGVVRRRGESARRWLCHR
jgi:hypothetical protein